MLILEILINDEVVGTVTGHGDVDQELASIGAEIEVFHERHGDGRLHSWLHISDVNSPPVSHILGPNDVVLLRILEA
jgi:hypothetical protein